MKNLRKADCCWNCKNSWIYVYYDDVYQCRCTVNADDSPYPNNPIFEENHEEFDMEKQEAFYKEKDLWEEERPDMRYGDICDLFSPSDALDKTM